MSLLMSKDESRKIITETLEQTTEAICSTMGPDGNIVTISRSDMPHSTKDGKQVAEAITFGDPAKDLIAIQISHASIKTDEVCGDGTTTTAFLTREFYRAFNGKMNFKVNRKLESLIQESVELVKKFSTEVDVDSDLLYNVLMTTSNNDPVIVGKVIDIYRGLKTYPMFELKDGLEDDDKVVVNPSLRYSGGIVSPAFTKDGMGSMPAIMNYNPVVLESELKELRNKDRLEEFLSFFGGKDGIAELVQKNGPIIIFARAFDEETISILDAFNRENRGFKMFIPVRIAGAGTASAGLVRDIAGVMGCNVMNGIRGFTYEPPVNPEDLPVLQASTTRFNFVTVTDTQKERLAETSERALADYESLDEADKRRPLGALVRSRYETLSGSSVTVYVGGTVPAEVSERKARYEDVGKVARSALMNGVVPGCGQILLQVAHLLSLKYDDDVTKDFCRALRQQTAYLLHLDVDAISYGDVEYTNLATGEQGKDAGELQIWDAAMATRTALEAGMRTALLLLNTSNIVLGNRSGSVRF